LTPEDCAFASSIRCASSDFAVGAAPQIDYNREMAFIAVAQGEGGENETLGVCARSPIPTTSPRVRGARASICRGGPGPPMMSKIIDYCRRQGTREIVGEILGENDDMLRLASRLGFALEPDRETGTIRARLALA